MKSKTKVYHNIVASSISPSGSMGIFENYLDLSALMETLVSNGRKPVVSNILIKLQMHQDLSLTSGGIFSTLPIIVQTAGTLTSYANLATYTISQKLDSSTNDEFGFQRIGNHRVSKFVPSSTSGNRTNVLQTQFEIPRNIVNLLNKEVSTERLQTLYLGLTGQTSNGATIYYNGIIEVTYIEAAKGITIR
jgi:hypothetical protein